MTRKPRIENPPSVAIPLRDEAVAKHRKWWRELRAFADAGDVAGFFAHYARYLKDSGIESRERELLYKMSQLAASKTL